MHVPMPAPTRGRSAPRPRLAWMLALALSLGFYAAPPAHDAAVAGDSAEKAAEKEKWGEHMGDLPFVVGYEKGMKEVEFTGRPPMYFFTTTW